MCKDNQMLHITIPDNPIYQQAGLLDGIHEPKAKWEQDDSASSDV
jgi:hypothetical protein